MLHQLSHYAVGNQSEIKFKKKKKKKKSVMYELFPNIPDTFTYGTEIFL